MSQERSFGPKENRNSNEQAPDPVMEELYSQLKRLEKDEESQTSLIEEIEKTQGKRYKIKYKEHDARAKRAKTAAKLIATVIGVGVPKTLSDSVKVATEKNLLLPKKPEPKKPAGRTVQYPHTKTPLGAEKDTTTSIQASQSKTDSMPHTFMEPVSPAPIKTLETPIAGQGYVAQRTDSIQTPQLPNETATPLTKDTIGVIPQNAQKPLEVKTPEVGKINPITFEATIPQIASEREPVQSLDRIPTANPHEIKIPTQPIPKAVIKENPFSIPQPVIIEDNTSKPVENNVPKIPTTPVKYPAGTILPQQGEIIDTMTFNLNEVEKPQPKAPKSTPQPTPKAEEGTQPKTPTPNRSSKIKVSNIDEHGAVFDPSTLVKENPPKKTPEVRTEATDAPAPAVTPAKEKAPATTIKPKQNEKVTITYVEPDEEDAPTEEQLRQKMLAQPASPSDSSAVFTYSPLDGVKIDPNRKIDTIGSQVGEGEYTNFRWNWGFEEGYSLNPVETPTGDQMGLKEFKIVDAWTKKVAGGYEISKKDWEERIDTAAWNEFQKYPTALATYIHNSVQKESIGAYAIEVEGKIYVINKDGMLAYESTAVTEKKSPTGRFIVKLVKEKNGEHLEMNGKKLETTLHLSEGDMKRFIENALPNKESTNDNFFFMYMTNEASHEQIEMPTTTIETIDQQSGTSRIVSLGDMHTENQLKLDASRRKHKVKYFVMQVNNSEVDQHIRCLREPSQKRIRNVNKVVGSPTNGTYTGVPRESNFVPKETTPEKKEKKILKHTKRKGGGRTQVTPDDFRRGTGAK